MFLITGASGFVGRALCAALDSRGLPFRPLSREPRPGHVTIGTMTPKTAWGEALQGVDCVIHLAARVHVMREQGADLLGAYRRDNVETTLNLARQATAAGVRRLVFLSTIKVNGEETPPGRPFTEADAPSPHGPYAQSKHEAEIALAALAAETGMGLVTIRPPLVYGPGVRANFRAMLQALRLGLPLPFAAVDNRRSLVAVDNLADLIIACASRPGASGQVILAADGEDLSTPQLLSALAEGMGRRARLFPVPEAVLLAGAGLVGRREAMRRLTGSLQVDTTRARTLLGWRPPVPAGEALAATARDYLTSVQN